MQVLRHRLLEMYTVSEVNIGLCKKVKHRSNQYATALDMHKADLILNAHCDLAQMDIARCP